MSWPAASYFLSFLLRNNAVYPGQKDIPVIFVTSHETLDVVERALSRNAGYVVKPAVPRILLGKVRAALGDTEVN